MPIYQRVTMPVESGESYALELYGVVAIIDGEPERTYCCSMTPSVWVEGVGWYSDCDTMEQREEVESGEVYSGYFEVPAVKSALCGEPFEADDLDDAREEASCNWVC